MKLLHKKPEQLEDLPEQTEQPVLHQIQKKIPLTHRTSAKVTAFLLVILMAALTCGSVFAAVFMADQGIYTTSEQSYRHDAFKNLAEGDTYTLIHYLNIDDEVAEQDAMRFLSDRNIASVEMKFSEGPRHSWAYDGGVQESSTVYTQTWYHLKDRGSLENWYSYRENYDPTQVILLGTVEATICLAEDLNEQDIYYWTDLLISLLYALRYAVYGIAAISLIMAIVCFVFLMCASGHRAGSDTIQPGWGTKVPLDLLTLGMVSAGVLLIQLVVEGVYYSSDWATAVLLVLCGAALLTMVLGWCMSLALRIKLGGWWKNTVVYHALRGAWFLLRKLGSGLWRGLRAIGRGTAALFRGIPLVWKTALALVVVAAVDVIVLMCSYCELDVLVIFWFFKYLVLIPVILLAALMLRKLQKGGEALAAGNLNHQVDTSRMIWDFKRHGENLNRIGEGMTVAVEQRMKSERMKTELITNVSHDIKTPLTSIINYTDLIEKEPCDNPKITEYAGVLHRQSDRLKRLIDDLVEASKASTGNLEVLLSPCEVGVMLTQTVGEYELRLRERNLELVTKQPALPVKIMADGRRLWRVFDNLMNNICKYGQSGTRVYLTLEERGGYAVISFKNTSREPLNLTEEELMERFVRGDAARNSEGNGLGLSIAKSLTELQNGSMELTVDGDLFKVILRFPTIS